MKAKYTKKQFFNCNHNHDQLLRNIINKWFHNFLIVQCHFIHKSSISDSGDPEYIVSRTDVRCSLSTSGARFLFSLYERIYGGPLD